MDHNIESRISKRNILNRTIKFEINDRERNFQVITNKAMCIDISSGGLGLQTDRKLSQGDMVKVEMPLSEGDITVPIFAKVVWSIKVDKFWVYGAHIASWKGQEEDIIAEVVAETIARLYERLRKVERGEAEPVNSIDFLGKAIARNYFIDLIRKDRRLIRFTQLTRASEGPVVEESWVDLSEKIHEAVFHESLFDRLAPEINRFPKKQKVALLVDIASRMEFGARPTSLQRAFLKVGVELSEYKQQRPCDAAERGRQSSLLSLAYKRVAKLPSVQPYVSPL